MAVITDNDTAYAARTATEPTTRTAKRAASVGLFSNLMEGNPQWYNNGGSVARTINVTGTAEKRRTATGR
jgi:hypothetical protein